MERWLTLSSFSIPIAIFISFASTGVTSFFSLFFSFLIIPFIELLLSPFQKNVPELYDEYNNRQNFYWMQEAVLFVNAILHLFFLAYFLFTIGKVNDLVTWFGHVVTMGISCGVLAINIAHEMGHRKEVSYQRFAQVLLGTSLYAHFFIEHNKGHHRHVSTPDDPASARLNEPVYFFLIRSIVGQWKSVWKLDPVLMQKFVSFEFVGVTLILGFFGIKVAFSFLLAAIGGILLLEVVNYIEHYGLQRNVNPSGRFEKVTPEHSWNSDHLLSRGVLFNLSRHSDHHAYANRPYPLLEHHNESPQLPSGYPGMMLLSLLPTLWFKFMNPRIPQVS
jgi:alkane 1-monooxygenase